MESASPDAAGIERFTFGKFKGRIFAEIAQADQGYCRWARSQENPNGQLANFVAFLKLQEGLASISGTSMRGTKRSADALSAQSVNGSEMLLQAAPGRSTAFRTTFRMQHQYLEMISSGRKRWEGRLNVGGAASLSMGSHIKLSSGRRELNMKVRSIRKYSSFEAMLCDLGVETCLPGVRSIAAGVSIYRGFPGYAEKELQFGVVALELMPPGACATLGM